MPDPTPGTERPYRTDDEWSRAVFARRTGQVAAFLAPYLRAGMRLLDCGCGPGSITVDLALAVAPGEAIGIDLREDALAHGRALARERRIANVTFQAASVYQLPYPDGSFDAAFACAVLQHLAAAVAALKEMRRVLKPGGVIGVVDGSSTITFRYPTNPLLEEWDTGRPSDALQLRALLREAGFARTQASGEMTTEAGPPAGSLEETRRVAQNHLIRLRGVLGKLAIAQGWTTKQELEQMAMSVIESIRPSKLRGTILEEEAPDECSHGLDARTARCSPHGAGAEPRGNRGEPGTDAVRRCGPGCSGGGS